MRNRCWRPSRRMGGPWFETLRTRLRNRGGPKIAAPHHEAARDRVCIKLTGIRSSLSFRSDGARLIDAIRLAVLAAEPPLQTVEIEIDHRRGEQREQLAH